MGKGSIGQLVDKALFGGEKTSKKEVVKVVIPHMNYANVQELLKDNENKRIYVWTSGRLVSLDSTIKYITPFSETEAIYIEAEIIEIFRKKDNIESEWVEDSRIVTSVVKSNELALVEKTKEGKNTIYARVNLTGIETRLEKHFYKRERARDTLSNRHGLSFKKSKVYETLAFDFVERIILEDQRVKIVGDITLIEGRISVVNTETDKRKSYIEKSEPV